MMVLFIWGKKTFARKYSFRIQPSSVVQKIGFEKGDKITM